MLSKKDNKELLLKIDILEKENDKLKSAVKELSVLYLLSRTIPRQLYHLKFYHLL